MVGRCLLGTIAHRLGLSSIIGYLLAGVLIGAETLIAFLQYSNFDLAAMFDLD